MRWIKYFSAIFVFLTLSCEIPSAEFDNPLDVEAAEEKGIDPPALIFVPDTVTVSLGGTAGIQVYGLEVENLGGAYIQISYDNSKLSFVSASAGDFLRDGSQPLFISEDDASNGIIDISTIYLGSDSSWVSGTGILANIIFNSTAPGQSKLQFTQSLCEFVDPEDISIVIKGFGVGVIDAK